LPSGRSVSSSTSSLHDERLLQPITPGLRAKPSREVWIDDTAAGGPLDGVTVTILNADKQIGTHVFTTVARNDAGLRWTGHD
jgi:hypothetical protein